MHWDKTLARILLILSVVHVAAAAPAIVRQRSLDVDEGVAAASEKRGNSGNTPRGLYPVPQVDNDRPSASGTAQLDNDPPPPSGAPHHPPPASGTAQLDNDLPPASGTSQLDNNRPSALGTPQLDNDPQPASGVSHLHNDPLRASETSSVHDDMPLGPDAFDEEFRVHEVHYVPSSPESDTPPIDNHPIIDAPPPHESETRPTNNHLFSDVIQDKLSHLAAFGAIVGAFSLFAYGVYELSNHDGPSKPNGRDLTSSSDVVGRGVSTHPRPPP